MRQIVLDTETTGLYTNDGHRIIEIGCVELENRQLTGNNLHFYFNPDRGMDQGAIDVHGLTNEFLADKPRFFEKAKEIMEYLKGAELIIHNAPFDLGFLNYELSRLEQNIWGTVQSQCSILDTLVMARKRHRGQRNSLDALCKRYHINNAHRTLHGALLDSEILAEVYLAMTGGQISLGLAGEEQSSEEEQSASTEIKSVEIQLDLPLPVIKATEEELKAHEAYVAKLN